MGLGLGLGLGLEFRLGLCSATEAKGLFGDLVGDRVRVWVRVRVRVRVGVRVRSRVGVRVRSLRRPAAGGEARVGPGGCQ